MVAAPDHGSPIAKVHYDVVDSAGKVVVPEKVVSGTDPTALPDIEVSRSTRRLHLASVA